MLNLVRILWEIFIPYTLWLTGFKSFLLCNLHSKKYNQLRRLSRRRSECDDNDNDDDDNSQKRLMHKKSEKTVFPLTFQCNDIHKKLLFDLIIFITNIKLVRATKFGCRIWNANLIIQNVKWSFFSKNRNISKMSTNYP